MFTPNVAKIIRMNHIEPGNKPPHPVWLGAQTISDPEKTIRSFFYFFELQRCHRFLWEMLHCTITDNEGMYNNDFPPATMLLFYENLSLLIEAAYLQHMPPPPPPDAA
jgi:hypothetical protein